MTTPDHPIRVFLVDDDPLVREVLKSYLDSAEGITVVETASDGSEALERIPELDVDVVLSDVYMQHMGGAELLRNLAARGAAPAFLAISSLDNDTAMLDILDHGGRGYILKSQPREEIILSVRQAVAGGTVISPAAMNKLLPHLSQREVQAPQAPEPSKATVNVPAGVSDTEQKVLELLCDGLSNADIAKHLNYSESTVKKMVSKLLSAYGVSSRLDLVVTVLNGRGPQTR
ncbi:response regulator [Corynebacterium faecium]|uniref:response regulator n=1 Tax=Corynebacterium faecium TaxID=3016001 RepID=UPI0022B4EB3F|nr:response regulator transcription factor [Corynebacterium faecium]